MDLPIIWQDDAMLAVNKPSGLLALPDGYKAHLPHVRLLLEPSYGRVWIVHRLDRETSGVMVLARSAAAHRALNTQFEQHHVEKVYHAIVIGVPEWETLTVELPLRSNVGHRRRTAVDTARGKPSITHLRVLKSWRAFSLVEARPATGRTHQIRAHLAACGFPVAGDPLYGPPATPETASRFKRSMLHALSLSLAHPVSGEMLTLQAPYPEDFQSALEVLEREID
jgi:RluA family pseudouridine synthase